MLILGGTSEARELAGLLGDEAITSLAGVTGAPLLPEGPVRSGGFGGVDGLTAYCRAEAITHIADATHPFAVNISRHAKAAADALHLPYVRLERPAWTARGGDHWQCVPALTAAAAAIPDGARVLVTTGRKDLAPFLARPGLTGIIRMIEAPAVSLPETWQLLLARPPFTVESDLRLMRCAGITHLVSKNSGGEPTRAKLDAARALGLPVIMLTRPVKPAALAFPDAAGLAVWLKA